MLGERHGKKNLTVRLKQLIPLKKDRALLGADHIHPEAQSPDLPVSDRSQDREVQRRMNPSLGREGRGLLESEPQRLMGTFACLPVSHCSA